MNSLFEDVLAGAVGYCVGSQIEKKNGTDIVSNYLRANDLETIIRDYARAHGMSMDDSLLRFQMEQALESVSQIII